MNKETYRMATKRARRPVEPPTIIRIYRPDPERQLKALQFLLGVKGSHNPAPPPEIHAPHPAWDTDREVAEEAPANAGENDSDG